ncbi:MAG: sigma-54 dependent transcriptional regulator [bacterium]|nr:sigma-54 dependent transcriptional regulator [bacterium]
MDFKILVIDDELPMREMLQRLLEDLGYRVQLAKNGHDGLAAFEAGRFHLVVTDFSMPGMDGLTLLREVKKREPHVPVVMVTAYATIDTAVEAIKAGAYDYITKPFDPDVIEITVKNALEHKQLVDENIQLKRRLSDVEKRSQIIGVSPRMKEVFHLIEKVAPTDATVLIQGESGTGKELVARQLKNMSRRAEKPFLSINCGALPENLLESELFGYEKGAFTGANVAKDGFFKVADQGTLFLDEIGEMASPLQVKLLRVLQDKEILTVGGRKAFPVDVRILSATNKNLKEEVEAGRFREDLFYRINVFTIHVPPLRERRDDIPLLLNHFVKRYNAEFGKAVQKIAPDLMTFFMDYRWPGNIRELENFVERAVLMSEGPKLELDALPLELREESGNGATSQEESFLPFKEAKESFERSYIERLLERFNGVVSQAAREAKIPRPNLYEKLKKYGITPKRNEPHNSPR